MIARVWRGKTKIEHSEIYKKLLKSEIYLIIEKQKDL